MALFSPFLSRRGRNQRQRKSGRGVSTMTNSLKESAEITRERIRAAADSASERAAHVRETAGERANSAYSNVRERSEEHTSELQSLMRISYAVFCLQKKTKQTK